MNRRIEYCSIAAGIVLLVSGFAKALDTAAFARLLTQYGADALRWMAPVLVGAELLLGLALLLGIRLRRAGAGATLLLAIVTAGYAYGLLFREVTDCGCFGPQSVLNGPPAATFLRNGVLLALTIAVWRGGDDAKADRPAVRCVLLGAMCLGTFICGYTFRTAASSRLPFHYEERAEAVAGTPLAELAGLSGASADSTYLVFAFSYTCPHCLNSIENLKRYEEQGAVDRVVALGLEHPAAERRFREVFRPEFELHSIPAEELFRLTNDFPTAWYIRGERVRGVIKGELPAAVLFQAAMKNKEKEANPAL